MLVAFWSSCTKQDDHRGLIFLFLVQFSFVVSTCSTMKRSGVDEAELKGATGICEKDANATRLSSFVQTQDSQENGVSVDPLNGPLDKASAQLDAVTKEGTATDHQHSVFQLSRIREKEAKACPAEDFEGIVSCPSTPIAVRCAKCHELHDLSILFWCCGTMYCPDCTRSLRCRECSARRQQHLALPQLALPCQLDVKKQSLTDQMKYANKGMDAAKKGFAESGEETTFCASAWPSGKCPHWAKKWRGQTCGRPAVRGGPLCDKCILALHEAQGHGLHNASFPLAQLLLSVAMRDPRVCDEKIFGNALVLATEVARTTVLEFCIEDDD